MTQICSMMLIDDNPVDQLLYRRMIARSGRVNELLDFLSADDAIAHMRANPALRPDVIFLDINMPRTDGFDFLEAVSTGVDSDKVPIVVMLTSSLNPKDERRAKDFPMVREFLRKPLKPQDVERVVKEYGLC